MGKAINAFVSANDETSESVQGTKLVFLDFSVPKVGAREKVLSKESNRVPHEMVVTEVREVKYLRDGYVKEDNITRKIVLESHGTEIVKEVLVPRGVKTPAVRVVGEVVRDLRRKDENGSQI